MSAINKWVPVAGKWSFSGKAATYEGPSDPNSPIPYGMALCEPAFRSGRVTVSVKLEEPGADAAARILFGYNHSTGANYTAGIGGHNFAYLLVELIPGLGWVPLQTAGQPTNLKKDNAYEIETIVRGTRVQFATEKIKVIDFNLRHPLLGDGLGLFAWGHKKVHFENMNVEASDPKAFVVMQFGDLYDSIYHDVIKPVCRTKGFDAFRADDIYRPGMILEDIVRGIIESDIVIAEVTSGNPNVYYEIGYSHAIGKSTILLVERNVKLPFDISSYRCIYYDNTIKGKNDVEESLGKHLDEIKGII